MPSLTFTVTAQQAQRIASALGRVWNLKDANDQPRDATLAEIKQFGIQRYQALVNDIEGQDAQKAALAAVVVPTVDIT